MVNQKHKIKQILTARWQTKFSEDDKATEQLMKKHC